MSVIRESKCFSLIDNFSSIYYWLLFIIFIIGTSLFTFPLKLQTSVLLIFLLMEYYVLCWLYWMCIFSYVLFFFFLRNVNNSFLQLYSRKWITCVANGHRSCLPSWTGAGLTVWLPPCTLLVSSLGTRWWWQVCKTHVCSRHTYHIFMSTFTFNRNIWVVWRCIANHKISGKVR